MLTVCFYDGFTANLVSFDAVITESKCKITRSSLGGKVDKEVSSICLNADSFDLLSILAALYNLDERYERPIDGLGSITCAFEWDNSLCTRYFSGYRISECSMCGLAKQTLEKLDELILHIRSTIDESVT